MSAPVPGRHLLLIAYDFPPIGGSGVQRMLKFVKHLPAHGWTVTVLTVRASQTIVAAHDDSLLAEVPDEITVVRSDILDPYDNPVFRAISTLGMWLKRTTSVAADTVSSSTAASADRPTSKGGALQRVLDLVHALMVPDRCIGWYPYARREGNALIRRQRPDVILTTSPCETSHLIGLSLARRHDIPLVTDFRDPWTEYYFALDRPWPLEWLNRRMERAVLKRAVRVISTEAGCSDSLNRLVPDEAAAKFQVITNGYDESDFLDIEPVHFDRFTLIFTGTVYRQVTPRNVFEALALLRARQPDLHERFQFVFVGNTYPGFDDLVQAYDLAPIVRTLGYRTHRESIEHLMGADLCYYNVFSSLAITGKLFEYMRSGTEILATVPGNHSAAAIIERTGTGTVVDYDAIDAIADLLAARMNAHDTGSFGRARAPAVSSETRRFERGVLSERLAGYLLDAATGNVRKGATDAPPDRR